MADKPVLIIKVKKGSVDQGTLEVRRGEGVTWVPETTNVKIKIKFKDDSPFDQVEFPTFPKAGHAVSAIVKNNATIDEEYEYEQPGSAQRAKTRRGDPIIIVRGDRRMPKRKKASAKKVARKR